MGEDNIFVCIHCGKELVLDDVKFMDDEVYCIECLDEVTVACVGCGERVWVDDHEGDEDTPLCSNCHDERYTTCSSCDAVLRYEDAFYQDEDEREPFCLSCYKEQKEERPINDYSFKPEPIFYGNGSRYFGVELEIDTGGKSNSNAREIIKVANRYDENIYIKSDGSLDCGFEIVTHPMTLEYHLKSMYWKEIANKALELGYYSHKTSTCGLHVHINKDCFGEREWSQEECISRVLYFVENHWNELLRFSRRTEYEIKRWAARYGRKDTPKEVFENAKSTYAGRYTCVNLTNENTIELRIFKGTLKYNTLIATLQMVNAICDVAIFMSDTDIAELSWSEFVASLDKEKVPELIKYLKERRLYINESIEDSEEE